MSGFIEWLEKLNANDTKVRAVLRRSLAFDPGDFPAAYPFVEPFLKNEDNSWRRQMLYLVAGLWAAHWRKARSGEPIPLGRRARFTRKRIRRAPNAASSLSWIPIPTNCPTLATDGRASQRPQSRL